MFRRVSTLVAVGLAGAGPVGYPAWLAWRTRGLPDLEPPQPPSDGWPFMTVVIPAYREAGLIEAKVADVHANGYPGRLEVIVVADDPETEQAANRTGAIVISSGGRRGKVAAVGAGVLAATGEIVLLTDANAAIAHGSLGAMALWFADPAVGAVAGEKRVLGAREDVYWRYESWLKRREARLGSSIGLVGELAAVRRSLLTPIPDDVAIDDLWIALDIIEGGHRIAYEAGASASEPPTDGFREDWERRTRVVSQTVETLWRRRALLTGHGPDSVQLWGHRLLRTTVGPVAHATLLTGATVRVVTGRSGVVGKVFVLGHVAAAGAAVASARGVRLPLPARIGGQVVTLQAVALGGLRRMSRREALIVWPKADRNADGGWQTGGA